MLLRNDASEGQSAWLYVVIGFGLALLVVGVFPDGAEQTAGLYTLLTANVVVRRKTRARAAFQPESRHK